MSTLLITSAISPPANTPILNLTSESLRLAATKASTLYWFTSGIEKLVLVDSTNTQALSDEEIEIGQKIGIEIEQIQFSQDSADIINKGKGYGEAMLLKYAVENSNILKNAQYFYKCTGKLFINNFSDIQNMINANSIKSLFWRWADGSYNLFSSFVDTRFYYTNIDFLKNHFIPSVIKTDEISGKNHEHQAFEIISSKMQFGLSIRPIILGVGGGSGKFYPTNNYGPIDSAFPCWLEYL